MARYVKADSMFNLFPVLVSLGMYCHLVFWNGSVKFLLCVGP